MTDEVKDEIKCISKTLMSIAYISDENTHITVDDIYNKLSEKWDVDLVELEEYLNTNYAWMLNI